LIAALSVVACGGSQAAPEGPTTAGVAARPGDLPSGMARCDLTGDINSFISQEQTADPNASKTTAADWQTAKKNGATDAYVAVYSDSSQHCSAIKGSSADLSAATYKLLVNFVIQFKDEKSAVTAYKSDNTIFGFSASVLRAGGNSALEGTATGLSANSIALSRPVGNQTFYIAEWQNKRYMVILAILNVDPAASKNVATAVNGRIK
jgi:hypothetical protein